MAVVLSVPARANVAVESAPTPFCAVPQFWIEKVTVLPLPVVNRPCAAEPNRFSNPEIGIAEVLPSSIYEVVDGAVIVMPPAELIIEMPIPAVNVAGIG